MPNLIGHSFGRYHILEQIGEGGMATVYKARDMNIERDVAIKIIRADMFGSAVLERMLDRFKREARALAKLAHPNIVPILDFGEYAGAPYLVMPYLPGGTLKRYLKNPIPYRDSARLLVSVARALAHAHQQGIIHRDVKPSNILITKTGEPLLSDFGIAKLLDVEETRELTGTGVGIGTPEYMAPEQGMGRVDARADVYALGIIFYEMVTGRRPYQADTPMAVMLKKSTEPLPRPTQFVPNLPAAVENVLIKSLAREPENRYQTMGAFADALEMLVTSKDTATMTGGFTKTINLAPVVKSRADDWKNWLPWVAGGLFSACCTIAAAALAWQFMSARPTPTAIPVPTTNTPGQPIPITETFTFPAPISITETFTLPAPIPTTETFLPVPPIPTTEVPPPTFTATNTIIPAGYDLAFVSDRNDTPGYMHVVIANTGNLNDNYIFENPTKYERALWPSFCGDRIAAEVYDTGGAEPQWIYFLQQGAQPEKFNNPVSAEALGVPRCSPNGRYMAYSARNNSAWDLLVADNNSGQILFQEKTSSYDNKKVLGYSTWSADSQSFIFEALAPQPSLFFAVNNFSNPNSLRSTLGTHASLSPDGSTLALACETDALCVVSASGGAPRPIFQTVSRMKEGWEERVIPVWSADGQWIYFVSLDGGDWDIFRIRPDGNGVENITQDWSSSNEFMPTLR